MARFSRLVIAMMMPITINIPSIPLAIYGRLSMNAWGLNSMPAHRDRAKTLSAEMIDKYIIASLSFRYFAKKLRIRPPAMTEAI